MRAFYCILALAVAAISLRADFVPDTDGDGQTDSQELAAGTDPAHELSVEWKSLAAWRFSDASLQDDRGALPTQASGVSLVEGLDGNGVRLTGASGAVRYRAVEADGTVKVAPKRGSIWFYIKPDWFSYYPEPGPGLTDLGNGPGHAATIFETDNFSLHFNTNGTRVILTSRAADGSTLTNLTLAVDFRSLDFRSNPSLPGISLWYNGLLTYTPTETKLYWIRPGYSATGTGIAPSTLPPEQRFISIGSNAAGDKPLGGTIDEVISFNALGALAVNGWQHSAVPSSSPAGVELVWNSATNAVVNIRRRVAGAREWQPLGAGLGSSYLDATAVQGVRYEYNLNTRLLSSFGDMDEAGHITGGTRDGTLIEDRGKVILLVDQTLAAQLEPELGGFVSNLVGDGWHVLRAEVPRHVDDYSSQTSYQTNAFNIANVIMPFIRDNYAIHGNSIRQILILGHVTVPYSGTKADDGHYLTGPHQGAWSTDLYYGDLNAAWTDHLTIVNSFSPWNWNHPGDGKFDQDFLPVVDGAAELEIPVARIDLANLPAFDPVPEVELLKDYLRRNAAYRTGAASYPPTAMGFDTHILGRFSHVPMQTASEMGSQLSVLGAPVQADPFAVFQPALVAAVSGPGGFTGMNFLMDHEHDTEDFASGAAVTPAAFYYVRSSYMADWNSPDNFLRAILAGPGGALASAAMFDDGTWRAVGLGMGDTLGSDVPDVIRNWSSSLISHRFVEILGDATLRYPVLRPPGEVVASMVNERVLVSWLPSPEAEAAYHLYRSDAGIGGVFSRVNAEPVSSTTYVDDAPPSGSLVYMVRAIAPTATGAGTFTNISQGAFTSGPILSAVMQCCIDDRTILEDSNTGPIDFPLGEQAAFPNVQFSGFSSDPSIVPESGIEFLPGSGNLRTLRVTPLPNRSGTVVITVQIATAGGTTQLGFWLTILPVNDPPSFTRGPNQFTPEGAGPREVPTWASHISPGAFEEQAVTFNVVTDRPEVFDVAPALSPEGTLTFSLTDTATGNVLFSVSALDNGGTANGGQSASAVQQFILSIGTPLDSDSDGMSDDYETAAGFNPFSPGDAVLDNDGDGFTNVQEFWAATDPFDSTSLLEIDRTILDQGGWRFRFSTVAGQEYTVEYNDSFPSGAWQVLASALPGTGSTLELADVTGFAAQTNRIYRIRTGDGQGNTVVSRCAGFLRQTAPGSNVSLYSQAFIRPPEARGVVQAISGHVLTIGGAQPWSLNRWLISATQTNDYFLMICSGALEGDYFPITGNTASLVALDLQGGTLAGLNVGDRVMIVPYSTLGSVFPAGRDVHPSPGFFLRHSEVFVPNLENGGASANSWRTFYYASGMWQEFGQSGSSRNSTVILPDMCLMVRHNLPEATDLVTHGAVLHTKFRVPLRRNAEGKQDNFVAIPRPGPMTLAELGLVQSGAFRASPGFFLLTDELFNFPPAASGAPVETFYFTTHWRKFGDPANFNDVPVSAPGRGFILRLNPAPDSVMWINSPNY